MNNDYEIVNETPSIDDIPIWSTHVYLCNNPFHDWLATELIALIRKKASQQETDIDSRVAISAKNNLIESQFNFLNASSDGVDTLRHYLEELTLTIAAEENKNCWAADINAQSVITESWFHITQNGGYHDAHNHPNCSWCGIYMLDSGQSSLENRSGVNRFYDPRQNANHYVDAGSQYLDASGIWDVALQSGEIIIFPSYLKHAALPYFGSDDRIAIAFNAQIHFC